MNKGTFAGCTVFVWLMVSANLGLATPVIDVGTHYLLANTQKAIPILVSGGDAVSGMNLFVQVGDGGPVNSYPPLPHFGVDTTPRITSLDAVGPGTLFQGVTLDAGDPSHLPDLGGNYLIWQTNPTLPTGSRPASGTLAYVTVDTTGTAPGFSRPLSLDNVATYYLMNYPPAPPNGYTTDFAGTSATINNGQIVIIPLHTMTWTGTTGNWTDITWNDSLAPGPHPPSPNYTADTIVNTSPAVVDVTAAREANSLAVSNGRVAIASGGSLHLTTNANLNPSGTLAIVSGGSLTGEASSAIQMSGGKLAGSGGSVTVTLPVNVLSGTSNSLEATGASDVLNISGPLTVSNGTTLNKDGLGTLNIPATAALNFQPGTIFNANAGTTNIASSTGANLTANASGGILNFTTTAQTLTGLGLSNGGKVQAFMGLSNTATTLGSGGGTLFVDLGKTVTTGSLTALAAGTLTKTGPGAMIINGFQSYIQGAVLQFGSPSGPSPQLQGAQGVPEPAALALLAAGAMALLLFRLRR